MNILRGFLVRHKIIRGKPHEKAELGKGTWGRQEAKTEPKATIKMRVYRAETDTWEEVN